MKIIRKPRRIGNENNNLSDAASNIVLKLELYEGKDIMKDKFGATAATTIRLTKPYHGTSKQVIADSWFGSLKTTTDSM